MHGMGHPLRHSWKGNLQMLDSSRNKVIRQWPIDACLPNLRWPTNALSSRPDLVEKLGRFSNQ
jgi:hypothetical protein